jgi:hypothetical protein
MDETRAVAKLPHLDIEVTHRRLSEENAEQLTISVRAVPSLGAVARWLELHPAWPWLVMSPLAVWQRAMMSLWGPMQTGWPWTEAGQSLAFEARNDKPSAPRGSRGGWPKEEADPKVHPFPGPDQRGS